MNRFFKNHPNVVITGLAILFITITVVCLTTAAMTIVGNVNTALGPGALSKPPARFDLEGAKALDLKGIIK